MNSLIEEIYFAWRALLKRPRFLMLASATLAIGIAACVTTFSLLHHLVLQEPPFKQAKQLAVVGMDTGTPPFLPLSSAEYQQIDHIASFSAAGAIEQSPHNVNVSSGAEPALLRAVRADRHLLDTLDVTPAIGRNFSPTEDAPGGAPVAIISYGLWQKIFGANPDVLKKTIKIDGVVTSVVGVLPEDFRFIRTPADIMLPLALKTPSQDKTHDLQMIARLAPNHTLASAQAEISSRLLQYNNSLGGVYNKNRYGIDELKTVMSQGSKPTLLMFFGFGICVLLIASSNLSNLMFLRILSKSHESSVRVALGAPALRLALPQLAEGLLVGLVGLVIGLICAKFALLGAVHLIPSSWIDSDQINTLNPASYAFAAALALLIALLSAAFGVWRANKNAVARQLVTGGRSGFSPSAGRLASAMVVIQAMLACTLLGTAGLLGHALHQLSQITPGFTPSNAFSLELDPTLSSAPDAASYRDLAQRLERRLTRIPGVVAAAASTELPGDGGFFLPMNVPGNPIAQVQIRSVGARFFTAAGIHLNTGRVFNDGDMFGAQGVAVVNRSFEQKYFAGHALGNSVNTNLAQFMPGVQDAPLRIIGVVDDVREFGPKTDAPPMVYLPYQQLDGPVYQLTRRMLALHVVVRVNGVPSQYFAATRTAVHEITPDTAVSGLETLDDIVARQTRSERLNLTIVSIMSVLALVLASIGLYSVTSVSVAAKQREFGVKRALGASDTKIFGEIMRHASKQLFAGLVLGWIVLFAAAPMLHRFMQEIAVGDAIMALLATGLMTLTGIVASTEPAFSACRLPITESLRRE